MDLKGKLETDHHIESCFLDTLFQYFKCRRRQDMHCILATISREGHLVMSSIVGD